LNKYKTRELVCQLNPQQAGSQITIEMLHGRAESENQYTVNYHQFILSLNRVSLVNIANKWWRRKYISYTSRGVSSS
jgi:hypothetical protein